MAGAPIKVEGRLWGVMMVLSREERLPAGTEARLAEFTELVAPRSPTPKRGAS